MARASAWSGMRSSRLGKSRWKPRPRGWRRPVRRCSSWCYRSRPIGCTTRTPGDPQRRGRDVVPAGLHQRAWHPGSGPEGQGRECVARQRLRESYTLADFLLPAAGQLVRPEPDVIPTPSSRGEAPEGCTPPAICVQPDMDAAACAECWHSVLPRAQEPAGWRYSGGQAAFGCAVADDRQGAVPVDRSRSDGGTAGIAGMNESAGLSCQVRPVFTVSATTLRAADLQPRPRRVGHRSGRNAGSGQEIAARGGAQRGGRDGEDRPNLTAQACRFVHPAIPAVPPSDLDRSTGTAPWRSSATAHPTAACPPE